MKNIIAQYFKCLESGDPEKIIQLFSDDAVIHSPLYGDILVTVFFKKLFSDTYQSEITLLNIFNNPRKPELFAAHFRYHWILKNGTVTSFECVDIFQCNGEGKIKELTIIYDTFNIREDFEKNH